MRILEVSAVVSLPIIVEFRQKLVDERDVGLSEDDVLSSMDSEIREKLRYLAKKRVEEAAARGLEAIDFDIEEYDIDVYNEDRP